MSDIVEYLSIKYGQEVIMLKTRKVNKSNTVNCVLLLLKSDVYKNNEKKIKSLYAIWSEEKGIEIIASFGGYLKNISDYKMVILLEEDMLQRTKNSQLYLTQSGVDNGVLCAEDFIGTLNIPISEDIDRVLKYGVGRKVFVDKY